ncbi:MAG: hypothetical protein E7012_03190 [Alphaproteobacteria bacterium]|nr:hypothetical protein [Alphaproteobacteria bacterium]
MLIYVFLFNYEVEDRPMSELSNLLRNTDFEHISLEDLVALEDSLQLFENTFEKDILENLKKKIADKYASFNDRFKIHKIRTGYDAENWGFDRTKMSPEDWRKLHKRLEKGWNANNGWKFHLDVVPNRNHPVTKSVSDFLLDLNVSHKIAAGGENGKGMTVYVGSYEDINKLAEVIQERFGKVIYEPPTYTDQSQQEYAFQPTVYGRFVPGKKGNYPWGVKGIGLVYNRYGRKHVNFNKSLEKAIDLGVVENKESVFDPKNIFLYLRVNDKENEKLNKKELYLRNYCCHKLYAEALGDYYCGSDIEAFEKSFFGDKLPAKGTVERSHWDVVAETFVEEAKTLSSRDHNGKNFFDFIKSFTDGYEPLDLSSIQTEKMSTKSNSVDADNTSKSENKPKQEKSSGPIQKNKSTQENSPSTTQENKQTISVEGNIPDPITKPVINNQSNKYFAEPYRVFYQNIAKKENSQYSEDESSPYYRAKLVRKDNSELNIVATPNNQVSLGAKDKDKKAKIPDYKDFNNLALLAKKLGKSISFGNINSPEFKARLMLACMENNVKMTNIPNHSELNDIDTQTKQLLKDKFKKHASGAYNEEDNNTPKKGKKIPDSIKQQTLMNRRQKY